MAATVAASATTAAATARNTVTSLSLDDVFRPRSTSIGGTRRWASVGLVVIVTLVSAVIVGTVLGRRYRVGPPVLLMFLGSLLGLIPAIGNVHINVRCAAALPPRDPLLGEMNTSIREIGRMLESSSCSAWPGDRYRGRGVGTARRWAWNQTRRRLGCCALAHRRPAVAGSPNSCPANLTVLKGESIINDGTALVLFAVPCTSPSAGPKSAQPI